MGFKLLTKQYFLLVGKNFKNLVEEIVVNLELLIINFCIILMGKNSRKNNL